MGYSDYEKHLFKILYSFMKFEIKIFTQCFRNLQNKKYKLKYFYIITHNSGFTISFRKVLFRTI